MQDFCNDLRIAILSYLANLLGMRLVAADATVLPKGWMMVDPALADAIGINKALIFQKIDGWVQHNRRKGKNVRDGRAWSYNSIPDWGKVFYWLHPGTVGKLIRELEDEGRLVSTQPNKKKADQTKHYSTEAGIIYDDEPQQMAFWPSEFMTLRGRKADDDSSTGSSKNKPAKAKGNKTPAPARAIRLFGGVGVFPANVPGSEMPEKQNEIPEQRPGRLDGSDLEDMDSAGSRATRAQNAPTPVPPPPFPDDTTEGIEDTEPIEVPSYAQIFAIPDAEVRGWIEKEPARLESWCAYAADQDNLYSPGGFVRTGMRIKGHMPPSCSSTPKSYSQSWMLNGLADEPDNYLEWIVSDDCNFGELHKAEARAILAERAGNPIRRDNTDGRAYITNEFADFIEH